MGVYFFMLIPSQISADQFAAIRVSFWHFYVNQCLIRCNPIANPSLALPENDLAGMANVYRVLWRKLFGMQLIKMKFKKTTR